MPNGGDNDVMMALYRRILGGGLTPGPDYQKPLYPSSWKEAGTNLLRGLEWYGGQNLQRVLGIPYQDPTQQALARTQLTAGIERLGDQATARRLINQLYGGDITKAMAPNIENQFFESPNINELTGKPESVMRTTESYTPQQRFINEVLWNKNLPQNRTEQEAEFERRMLMMRTLAEQGKANTAAKYQALQFQKQKEEDRAAERETAATLKQQQFELNKVRSKREGVEYATKLGHDPSEIGDDLEKSLDENGNIDYIKFSKNLKTNPAYKEKIRQFNLKMDIMKRRAAAAESAVKAHAARTGQTQLYAMHRQMMARWRANFDAFANDLSNIGKSFSEEPPTLEDAAAMLQMIPGANQPGVAAPGPTAPQPRRQVPFVSPPTTPGGRIPDELDRKIDQLIGG